MTINYSKQVLLKRGNTAVSSTYVGPLGEVTYDTDLYQLRVHDGERAGGWLVPGGPEYDLLLPLIGNAASQQDQIDSLFANAAVQQALITNLVNQGNVDPGTDNETFWFNTEDGRLYIKWEDMWVDSSPTVLPSPGYITGIMEDFAGNIVPAANVTYSLGTQEAQWKDLWVSNNTIYIGNTPITVSNGSLLVNGNTVTGGSGDRLTNSSNEVVLDENGTLTVPGSVTFPVIFAARFDGEHYHGGADPFRGLTDAEWSTEVTIRVVNDSLVVFMDPISNANNPGYVNNDWFAFTEADHGIPGYTLSILFSSVLTNPVQIAVNQPPGYTATIKSANSIGLQAGTNVWQFGTDGSLTVPGGQLVTGEGGLAIQSTGEVLIAKTDGTNTTSYVGAGTNVTLATSKDGNGYYWNFTDDGNLILPSQLSIGSVTPYYPDGMFEAPQGTLLTQAADTDLNLYTTGANARTVIGWLENPLNSELGGNVAEIQFNNYLGEVRVAVGGYGNAVNAWRFLPDGNLVLPGGSAKLGDTFGDGGLTLQSPSESYVELGSFDGNAYIWVADTGYYNDAGRANAAIYISTDYNNADHRWTFDPTGNLTLPVGGDILDSTGQSVLGGGASTGNITFNDANIIGSDGTLIIQANIARPDLAWTFSSGVQGDLGVAILAAPMGDDQDIGQIVFSGSDGTGSLFYAGNIASPWDDAMNLAALGANTSVKISTGAGEWQWTFGNTGNLSTPYGSLTLDSGYETGTAGFIASTGGVALGSTMLYNSGNIASQILQNREGFGEPVQISVYQDNDNPVKTWTFDNNGITTLPGNIQSTAGTGPVTITSNDGATDRTWTFGTNGSLTLANGAKLDGGTAYKFATDNTVTQYVDLRDTSQRGFYTDSNGFTLRSSGSKNWEFAPSGILTLPSNSYLETTDANLKVGSQGNVTIRANAATVGGTQAWTFGTNGVLTFPDTTTQGTAYKRTTGSWTVATGSASYSFEVPLNGTYVMWVRGNIPNGIITWNATATVTNNNVPVLGQQFAWNYDGAGTPISLTALPHQFVGTSNTIITTMPSVGTSTNVFTFTINNTSGESQTVYWGYVTQ